MRITEVDFLYLAMPEIRDIGDGSQDALLVRVRSDDCFEGWGECEAGCGSPASAPPMRSRGTRRFGRRDHRAQGSAGRPGRGFSPCRGP